MAQFRPAGLSDEDTDSDDYGFYEKPIRNYNAYYSTKKKIEIDLQEAIINGNVEDVEKIVTGDLNNSVDIKLDSGWTPLMHACFHAQDKIVKYLLDMGADANLHAATLQYTLREYGKIQNQIKFEPPDSPILVKTKTAAKNMIKNINSIRREIRNMKYILNKISRNNPQPVDIISEPTAQEIAVGYLTEVVIVCSIGFLLYHAKNFIINSFKK
ncbi:hypothetical protein O3G_MSEX013602 [Manduca sexta]|uniref:Uncharacterized protein n=1 Tax=Manduca sexta TaxID=7130 RepID=A0A921ZSN1_MANSE|nr:hypothetical protein O3G_MSEX013602 [Manduca sexta]